MNGHRPADATPLRGWLGRDQVDTGDTAFQHEGGGGHRLAIEEAETARPVDEAARVEALLYLSERGSRLGAEPFCRYRAQRRRFSRLSASSIRKPSIGEGGGDRGEIEGHSRRGGPMGRAPRPKPRWKVARGTVGRDPQEHRRLPPSGDLLDAIDGGFDGRRSV